MQIAIYIRTDPLTSKIMVPAGLGSFIILFVMQSLEVEKNKT